MKGKKELRFENITIVFDSENKKLDNKRVLMVRMFELYANFINKEVKVIFFHGKGADEGITCYFRKNNVGD